MSNPRLPRPEELDDLDRLLAVCFGYEPDESTRRERRRSRPVSGEGRIIAVDGKPVSHIRIVYNHLSVQGAKIKTAGFGGVCTHPDYRGRGIATTLLNRCIGETAAAGARLLIISGERGLYRRAHAMSVGPVWKMDLRHGSEDGDPRLTARRAAAPDWPVLSSLHQAESVRFVRAAEFFSRAASTGHRHIWLIEHGARPVAYLCLSRIWGLPHGARVRVLGEYGGARSAIVAGLHAVFLASGLTEIKLEFPSHDRELAYLYGCRGVGMRAGTIRGHTMRLLDLPGLMRDLRPYLAARLPRQQLRQLSFDQRGETCVFSSASQQTHMDLSHAASFILGGPGAPKVRGGLGDVLSLIFPIPLPMPGLNYV